MKKRKIKNLIFIAFYSILVIFLCINSAESGTKSSETSGFVENIIKRIPLLTNWLNSTEDLGSIIRKVVGHFGSFALLGFLGYYIYGENITSKNKSIIINLVTAFLIATLTEIIQIFAENRGPSFQDVILDFQGYLTITLIILIFEYKIKNTVFDGKYYKEILISYFIVFTVGYFSLALFPLLGELNTAKNICQCILAIVLLVTFFTIIVKFIIKLLTLDENNNR